jgi:hypothetical protein
MYELKLKDNLVCLELTNSTPYKKKKALIELITSNGGRVSFIMNKSVSYLLKEDRKDLDTYKCKQAFKLGIPVFSIDLIYDYFLNFKSNLQLDHYLIKNKKNEENFKSGKISNNSKPSKLIITPL